MLLHLQFEQTPEMAYDFALYHWKSNRFMKVSLLLLALLGIFFIVGLFFQSNPDKEMIFTALLPLVMVGVLWFWFIPFTLKRQAAMNDTRSRVGRERDMSFEETGITVKTQHTESFFGYEGITHWAASEMCYFLFISSNQAFILPKSVLTDDKEAALLSLLSEQGIPQQ
ncbi:MAG: YcxB family protein [Saprospiraceae bacterium]